MFPKLLSQQELCDAIYTTVFKSKKPLSRREICEAIERKKSPHILAMIEHLASSGYFKKESRIDKFGREGFVYSTEGKKKADACQSS